MRARLAPNTLHPPHQVQEALCLAGRDGGAAMGHRNSTSKNAGTPWHSGKPRRAFLQEARPSALPESPAEVEPALNVQTEKRRLCHTGFYFHVQPAQRTCPACMRDTPPPCLHAGPTGQESAGGSSPQPWNGHPETCGGRAADPGGVEGAPEGRRCLKPPLLRTQRSEGTEWTWGAEWARAARQALADFHRRRLCPGPAVTGLEHREHP